MTRSAVTRNVLRRDRQVRNWALDAGEAIKVLLSGETVSLRPYGQSMTPRVESGQLVTLRPLRADEPAVGDVVLVRVGGKVYLHLVRAVDGGVVLIGNNRGHLNGWTIRSEVFGKLVEEMT